MARTSAPPMHRNGVPAAETAFRALIRAYGLIERIMHGYFSRFGISGAQWGVLRHLHRAAQEGEKGMRVSELSQRLLIRPPSVTGVVDRLEESGLVSKSTEAGDLRARRVSLTAEGQALVERVLTVHSRQLASIMEGLDKDEQQTLSDLLNRLGDHLELLASPRNRRQSENQS